VVGRGLPSLKRNGGVRENWLVQHCEKKKEFNRKRALIGAWGGADPS